MTSSWKDTSFENNLYWNGTWMTNVSGHCKLRIRQSNRPTGAILHNVCHVTVHICHHGNKPNYQQSRRWIAKKLSLALSNCMNCWRAESRNLRATMCNKDMAFLTYQGQCTVISTEVRPSTTMTTGHVNPPPPPPKKKKKKKSEGPIFRPIAETWHSLYLWWRLLHMLLHFDTLFEVSGKFV